MLTFRFTGDAHRVSLRVAEFTHCVRLYVLPATADPRTRFTAGGELVYDGVSVRVAWAEVQRLVPGAKAPPRLRRRLEQKRRA